MFVFTTNNIRGVKQALCIICNLCKFFPKKIFSVFANIIILRHFYALCNVHTLRVLRTSLLFIILIFVLFFYPKIFKINIVIFWLYLNRQTDKLKQANLNILLHDIAQYLGMKYIEIFLQIFWMQVLSSILLRLLITSLLCSLSPTTLMQTTWTPWSSRLTTRMPQRLASCIQRRINPRNTTRKFTNKYQKKNVNMT